MGSNRPRSTGCPLLAGHLPYLEDIPCSNPMKFFTIIYVNIWQATFFLLLVVLLFNSLTDFATKVGLIEGALKGPQLYAFGMASTCLAFMNMFSNKFFGFTLMH
jgi:hypothetical protein